MSDSAEERVAEFIELREAGAQVTAAEFAARYPEMEARLLRSLDLLRSTEELFPTPDSTPEMIGPWVVQREIGRGGMGRVLLAFRRDDPDRRPFALKVLSQRLTFEARSIRRIEREGEILQRLNHPGLVRFEEISSDSSLPWIAMEYVEGQALSSILAEARIRGASGPVVLPGNNSSERAVRESWRALADFGALIAEATAEAHGAGLVHRDIKPSNVIVRDDGTPVLIDFGLAAADASTTLTRTGDLLGTPQYMSPEQARGERADARTDVWSLGATLFECATLRSPVPATEPLAIISWLSKHRPARLSADDSVPRAMAGVIDRALSFRPQRRYGSMQEFAKDLRGAGDPERSRGSKRGTSALERVEDGLRAAPRAFIVGLAAVILVTAGWGVAFVTASARASVKATSETTQDASAPSSESEAEGWLRTGTLAYLSRDRAELIRCADEALRVAAPGSLEAQRAQYLRGVQDPKDLPAAFADPDLARLADAIRTYRAGSPTDAISTFRSAVQRAGNWVLPLVLLGEAARDAGDLELCEREWTAAVRTLPGSPHLFRRLGKVRRQRDDLEGAIDAFRRAEELEPRDWRNAAELARALVASQRPEARREALAVVDRAVELCDSPTPSLLNVKAVVLDTEDRREDARKIYRSVLAQDPDHFWSHFNLGFSYSLDCQLSESRHAYEEAVRVRPKSVEAQFALAHLAVGAEAPACALCQDAVDRDGALVDSERALRHLTLALRSGARSIDWLPRAAAELAVRMERTPDVARVIEEELAESSVVDEGTVRLERALRSLGH